MRLTLLVVAIQLSLGAGIAYADSDGYYCIGRGYVAYQFGFAAPPIGPHRLSIVRIGRKAGIEAPIVFELPRFQVQGILVTAGRFDWRPSMRSTPCIWMMIVGPFDTT